MHGVANKSKLEGASRKRKFKESENGISVDESENGLGEFVGINSRNLSNSFSDSNVDRKDMKLGTLVYGVVDDVSEKELTISLPGLNKAVISVENTIENDESLREFTKRIEKLGLNERFTVGQPVNCAIISNNKTKNNLTIKPSILNAGLNSNSKCFDIPGYVISGLLISKESYGYNVHTGISGIKNAFMKFSNKDSYKLGQVLLLNVNKYYRERSLLICTPFGNKDDDCTTSDMNMVIKRNEMLSIYEIKPGIKLECFIHSYGESHDKIHTNKGGNGSNKKKRQNSENVKTFEPNSKVLKLNEMNKSFLNDEEILNIQEYIQENSHSLKVSFLMGTMLGVVPSEHSIHPLSCFYEEEYKSNLPKNFNKRALCSSNNIVIARIIAVLSDSNNKIVLSILPHIVNDDFGNYGVLLNKTVIPTSMNVENSNGDFKHTTITNRRVNSSLNITLSNTKGKEMINFVSKIEKKWYSMYMYPTGKDVDKIIATSPYRIISYSRLENSYLVSFDQKIVNEKYFSLHDIAPGQIVEAKVLEINNWGLSVRLSDYFSGRVYVEHLFNTRVRVQTGINGGKTMNQEQLSYIKRNYQIGREYKFRILRYEYSDNSWNPLLLLTAKKLLINDKLPIITSISDELKIGQVAVGYISRICIDNDNKQGFNPNGTGSYIIVRFYGEAYGSISYKEYINHHRNYYTDGKEVESLSVPKVGDVVTVKIKNIDSNGVSKSLKLSLDTENENFNKDSLLLPSNVKSMVNQLKSKNKYILGYFENLFDNSGVYWSKEDFIDTHDIILIGITKEKGLLFIKDKKEFLYLRKSSISDSKRNSDLIFNIIFELYKQSKSIKDLNLMLSKLFDFKSNVTIEEDRVLRQKINLITFNFNNKLENDMNSVELSLCFKCVSLKYSLTCKGNDLRKGTLCWGYITHIDNYGLLVSIKSQSGSVESKKVTGLVPKHLISSEIYFDNKEELSENFEIDESLILKVVNIKETPAETDKRITLSCRDTFAMLNEPILKEERISSVDVDKFINQIFESEKQDVNFINTLVEHYNFDKENHTTIGPEIIGRIIEFGIIKNVEISGYESCFNVLASLSNFDNYDYETKDKNNRTMYLRLIKMGSGFDLDDQINDSKQFSVSKKNRLSLFGLVLGGGYRFCIEKESSGTFKSRLVYVHSVMQIKEDSLVRYKKVRDLLEICKKKSINISDILLNNFTYEIKKSNVAYVEDLYSVSLLDAALNTNTQSVVIKGKMAKLINEIETLPIIVYSNRFDREEDVKREENGNDKNKEIDAERSCELECSLLDLNANNSFYGIPVYNSRVIRNRNKAKGIKNKCDSNTKTGAEINVDDVVECKIIDHMNMYNGLIVQLKDKSFGRIHILELDDDNLDKPLSMEKYKIGNTIQGIVYDRVRNERGIGSNKKVLLSKNCFNSKMKYVNLSWEISSKISRVRKISYKDGSNGSLIGIIKDVSEITQGSIISGYISNSGREGVFVRYGLNNLVGRIKLRELTSGTITPEEAKSVYYPGRYIKQMIVINVSKENRVDLSLSKLQSDDIKLRISQLGDSVLFSSGVTEMSIDSCNDIYEPKNDVSSKTESDNVSLGGAGCGLVLNDVNKKLNFGDLYVGRVLGGVIKNISKKHGLFIRLTDLRGEVVALANISECLDTQACDGNTVSSVFSVGDRVLCKVIKLDLDNEKVWVGIKPSYFERYRSENNNNDSFNEENKINNIVKESNIEGVINKVDEEKIYDSGELENEDHSFGSNFNENKFYPGKEEGFDTFQSSDEDSDNCKAKNHSNVQSKVTNNDFEIKKNINRNKKIQKQLEKEHRLRQEEERGMNSHLNPTTLDDFERVLVTHRDVSSIWIKYMSYYLDNGDLEKARAVAERSLNQISVKEEMERWNIWIAYINMEIVYGGGDIKGVAGKSNSQISMASHLSSVIERALVNVYDQKRLYIQIYKSFKKHSNEELGLSVLQKGLKKYPTSRKLWVTYLTSLYENNNHNKARDEVIQKSLKSVSKDKVIRLITDIARLEFEYGNVNRGRTIFENLLDENPKRMDLWSQYFDILTKLCINTQANKEYIEMVRSIFKSSSSNKNLKPRSMKTVFTRWLSFEKQFGNGSTQKNVQELAISYVNSLESKL